MPSQRERQSVRFWLAWPFGLASLFAVGIWTLLRHSPEDDRP